MLFDLDKARRHFDEDLRFALEMGDVRFSGDERQMRDWIVSVRYSVGFPETYKLEEAARQFCNRLMIDEIKKHPEKYRGKRLDVNALKQIAKPLRGMQTLMKTPKQFIDYYTDTDGNIVDTDWDARTALRITEQLEQKFWKNVANVFPKFQQAIE